MAVNNSNAFPPLDNSVNSGGRSPTSGPGPQVNGNGGNYSNSYIPPLPVGHQQDLNFLYQQIQELSGILQSNREKVNDVTKSAEEVAVWFDDLPAYDLLTTCRDGQTLQTDMVMRMHQRTVSRSKRFA